MKNIFATRSFRIAGVVLFAWFVGISGQAVKAEQRLSGHASSTPSANDPKAFWVSEPVQPNETVLLQGANFGGETTVEMARLDDSIAGEPQAASPKVRSWTPVEVLQATPASLKFVVPQGWPEGILACRVSSHGQQSDPFMINAPKPWWIQGDRGRTALPGGWLRVFGLCLQLDSRTPTAVAAKMALVQNYRVARVLPAREANKYALTFDVPADLPSGQYACYLHNGHGGPSGWTKLDTFDARSVAIVQPAVWATKIFDVSTFAGADHDAQIAAALAAAQANGGGVVYFPAGNYSLNRRIAVPVHTVLKGKNAESSILSWPDLAMDKSEKPPGLVVGSSFGLEDLTITAGPTYQGVGVCRANCEDDWGFLRRIKVILRHADTSGHHAILIDKADNTEVTDCFTSGTPRALGVSRSNYCRITGNTLHYAWNGTTIANSRATIIEDNELVLSYQEGWHDSGSNMAAYGSPFAKDLYFARNRVCSPEHHDNGFTFDGGDGLYFGKVVTAEGVRVTLEKPPMRRDGTRLVPCANWIGASLHTMDGHGAGQYRHIVGFDGAVVTVDRPWDVPPDGTSIVSLVNFIGRTLLVENDFRDAVWTQAYCMTADVVFAGNRMTNPDESKAGHLNADAGGHNGGIMPGWHFQVLDNSLVRGTTWIGCNGRALTTKRARGAGLDFDWYTGPVMSGCVFRGNRADPGNAPGSYAHIGSSHSDVGPVRDVIIERCEIPVIQVEKGNSDILIRDNTWNGGQPQYRGPGINGESVLVLPRP